MPNNQTPETEQAAREALARAKAARDAVKQEARDKEQALLEKKARRIAFLKGTFCRSCLLYTLFCILYFLAYLIIIFPQTGKTISAMLLGGVSVTGHALFYLAALLGAAVYSLVLCRQPQKAQGRVMRYLTASCIRFCGLQILTIALHGLYLDMLYNPYEITTAMLLRGPSFLLTFCSLGFALSITLCAGILRIERLHPILRFLLHLTSILTLTVIFFYVIASGFSKASDLLVFLCIFATLYAIAFAGYYAFRGARQKEENEEEGYENLYMTDALRRQRAEQDARDAKKKEERLSKFRKS